MANQSARVYLTWLIVAYVAVGYWYFLKITKYYESRDNPGTVILNSTLAITIGPILLVSAVLIGLVYRIKEYIDAR